MTTPAAPEWHERVTRCTGCPFAETYGVYDDRRCTATVDPSRDLTDDEYNGETVPEWCPLRAGPRVVRLAEEG